MAIEDLKARIASCGLSYIADAPMNQYTTLKIGGKADLLVQPRSTDEVVLARRLAFETGTPVTFIGNGSNLLVRDGGIRGLVVRFGPQFSSVRTEGDTLIAQSGISLAALAQTAAAAGLTGLEFASGIPGTLGGGIMMNAGAYKGEMKDVVTEATALCEDGSLRVFRGEELDFSYRHSCFTDSTMLVLEAKLTLRKGDRQEIYDRMRELALKRRTTQPLEYPSAGSAFKRPATGYAAAMIDACGLKGYRVGDAQVSEKHAGFVINRGAATAKDVLALLADVQKAVKEKFDTALEPEVVILGEA